MPLTFASLEFHLMKEITHAFTIDKRTTSSNYEAMIRRDLSQLLKIDVLFSKARLIWDDLSFPMKTALQVQELIHSNLNE